jgi:phosphopantetheine adenylyltransferase
VDFQGLIADFAKECKAMFIIRGLRSTADFDYEHQMAVAHGFVAQFPSSSIAA